MRPNPSGVGRGQAALAESAAWNKIVLSMRNDPGGNGCRGFLFAIKVSCKYHEKDRK